MNESSIEYGLRATPLGRLLVAGTSRGVCWVGLGARDAALLVRLEREFPFASLRKSSKGKVKRWTDEVGAYLAGRHVAIGVPLDVRGSPFQERVWAALHRIPRGRTRAYSEVARRIGRADSARAVARACATNPVPIVTPCHRVVRASGELGGYAYGVARKRRLLELEDALR